MHERPPREERLREPDPREGPTITESELEAALRAGARRFDSGRHWDAHEAWEAAWHRAPEPDRDFFRGLIHAAAALVHHQRKNAYGFERQRERMRKRLEGYGVHRGVDVDALVAALDALPAPGAAVRYPVLGLA